MGRVLDLVCYNLSVPKAKPPRYHIYMVGAGNIRAPLVWSGGAVKYKMLAIGETKHGSNTSAFRRNSIAFRESKCAQEIAHRLREKP